MRAFLRLMMLNLSPEETEMPKMGGYSVIMMSK